MFLDAIQRRNAHIQQIMDGGRDAAPTTVIRISDTCADCRQAVRGDVAELLRTLGRALDPEVMTVLLLKAQYGEHAVGAEEHGAAAQLASELVDLLHADLHVERRPLPVRSHS